MGRQQSTISGWKDWMRLADERTRGRERESRELAAQSTDVRMRLREHKEWTGRRVRPHACTQDRFASFVCHTGTYRLSQPYARKARQLRGSMGRA